MNIEELREYCLLKKGSSEGFPFDETTLVFKVMNKMFAIISLDGDLRISLKCKPEKAIQLRERYPEVQAGYHLNKQLWNTLDLTGNLTDKLVWDLIDHSYDLITTSLPKKLKEELKNL